MKNNYIVEIIIICLTIIVCAFMFRYQIIPIHQTEGICYAYKINRITGEVYLLAKISEMKVKEYKRTDEDTATVK